MGDLTVKERVLLKLISETYDMKVWTELSWRFQWTRW